jgi:hypothetical protein
MTVQLNQSPRLGESPEYTGKRYAGVLPGGTEATDRGGRIRDRLRRGCGRDYLEGRRDQAGQAEPGERG